MGGPNSGAKDRKPGEWEAVVRSRTTATINQKRELRTTRGVTNVPRITETGSAAYRRLVAKSASQGMDKRILRAQRRSQ